METSVLRIKFKIEILFLLQNRLLHFALVYQVAIEHLTLIVQFTCTE